MYYWQEEFKTLIEETKPGYTKKVEEVYKFSDGEPTIVDWSCTITKTFENKKLVLPRKDLT